MRSLLLFAALLATPALSTPIYRGAASGQHHQQQILHVRHVDEQGRVTYIHDNRDHRPDFCTIPGAEELCRQQIEAANNAPAVYDNDTIILNTPHDPNELYPGHDVTAADPIKPVPGSDSHVADTTFTLDNGDVITIHNENGHIPNINSGGVNINLDGPADGGHVRNINVHGLSDTVDNISHPRNINDIHNDKTNQDAPDDNVGHPRNTNDDNVDVSNGPHQRNIHDDNGTSSNGDDVSNVPHQRNIHDNNGNGSDGNVSHQRNINDGQSIKEKLQSHPIVKLQETIKKQASS